MAQQAEIQRRFQRMVELPYLLADELFGEAPEPVQAETPVVPVQKTTTTPKQKGEDPFTSRIIFLLSSEKLAPGEINKLEEIPHSSKSLNEKLYEVEGIVSFLSNFSAQKLAWLFDVSKQAILKTPWWKKRMQARRKEKQKWKDRYGERGQV